LDSAACGGDKALDGGGAESAGEFFVFGFLAFYDGDGEEVFVDTAVEVKDCVDFFHGQVFGEMGRVAFLPEEFPRAEKGLRMFEFPADDYRRVRYQPTTYKDWEDGVVRYRNSIG
jgi:hypothetical protein